MTFFSFVFLCVLSELVKTLFLFTFLFNLYIISTSVGDADSLMLPKKRLRDDLALTELSVGQVSGNFTQTVSEC